MLVLSSAIWGKHTNAAATAFVTPKYVLTGAGRGKEQANYPLSSCTNYEVTKHSTYDFYLQVIDLHGILIIESLDGLASCLGSICKPEPKQEPPYAPPSFCLMKFHRIGGSRCSSVTTQVS